MKSIAELKKILSSELNKSLNTLPSEAKSPHSSYNHLFGNVSFIVAGILEQLLNESYDWGTKYRNWIDDALIADFNLYEDKLSVTGVMIWGTGHTTEQWVEPFSRKETLINLASLVHTTEQWVEPFYFDIALHKNKVPIKVNFKQYNLFFGDSDNPAIPYKYFINKREYWAQDSRNWEYRFSSK